MKIKNHTSGTLNAQHEPRWLLLAAVWWAVLLSLLLNVFYIVHYAYIIYYAE
jgi:hypothetical protein